MKQEPDPITVEPQPLHCRPLEQLGSVGRLASIRHKGAPTQVWEHFLSAVHCLALPTTHYHIRKHKVVVCGLCEVHTHPARVEEVAETHNVAVLQPSHYLQLTVLRGGGRGRGEGHSVDEGAEQKVNAIQT